MYRLTTNVSGSTSYSPFGTVNDALKAGAIFLDINCPNKKDRTGALRANGRVDMWSEGASFGHAIIERLHPSLGWTQIG